MTATATADPPAAWAALETALRQRRPVRLSYHGHQRLISPHALGWKNNRPMLLGYQTGAPTTTQALPAGPQPGWRNMFVDEIEHVAAADPASTWQTADNYNPSHPFNSIDHITVAITTANLPQQHS